MGTETGSSTRWLLVGVAVALAAGIKGCSEAKTSSATFPTTTVFDVLATTTPGSPSTSTTPGSSFEPEGARRICDAQQAVRGDFDGDRTVDLVVFDAGTLVLVVCTADRTMVVPGSGQGEVLIAVDLNGDGTDEILSGGTAAWGAGAEVVAVVDSVLDYVHTPDGDRLALWEGLPPDGFIAYGCADFTNDGHREVAVVEGSLLSATEASWHRSIYRITGHDAIPVRTDGGASTHRGRSIRSRPLRSQTSAAKAARVQKHPEDLCRAHMTPSSGAISRIPPDVPYRHIMAGVPTSRRYANKTPVSTPG